ncbi:hypothetical protein EV368DRAFT_66069 [Lentinula lateritia]|nr:hypothetical protein EV368DRAFT_66069 [Lentinula lateritia]
MFLFSLASSRRLHQILLMYLFFTVMLVNVPVFAATTSRRVGTNRELLSNKIGFAPDQQFVLFVGNNIALQYHHDTGKTSNEIGLVDFNDFFVRFGSSAPHPDVPFIKLGTDRRQDISIKLDTWGTMTAKTAGNTMFDIHGLPGFWGLIQDVEDLQKITGVRITSDLEYVDAVFEALMKLKRAGRKKKLLKLEDYQEWKQIYDVNRKLRNGPITQIYKFISRLVPLYHAAHSISSYTNCVSPVANGGSVSKRRCLRCGLSGTKRVSVLNQLVGMGIGWGMGSTPVLFVGTAAFRGHHVEQQLEIKRLEEPSLKCCRLVYDELIRILGPIVNQKSRCTVVLMRYPASARRERFNAVAGCCGLFEDLYNPPTTKLVVSDMVSMQACYVNTTHPDFINGHKLSRT